MLGAQAVESIEAVRIVNAMQRAALVERTYLSPLRRARLQASRKTRPALCASSRSKSFASARALVSVVTAADGGKDEPDMSRSRRREAKRGGGRRADFNRRCRKSSENPESVVH